MVGAVYARFNVVHLLTPSDPSHQISGDACPMGYGIWNPDKREYCSSNFPHYLQDPAIPIHIKEFMCIIVAVKQWGIDWVGKSVQIFCDNDSVYKVIYILRPKDLEMQRLISTLSATHLNIDFEENEKLIIPDDFS